MKDTKRNVDEGSLASVIAAERSWFEIGRGLRSGASEINGDLVGLAFSAGGYRSAAFAHGVVDGLEKTGLMKGVDYVSGVGGGASVTAWVATDRDRNRAQRLEAFRRLLRPPSAFVVGLRQLVLLAFSGFLSIIVPLILLSSGGNLNEVGPVALGFFFGGAGLFIYMRWRRPPLNRIFSRFLSRDYLNSSRALRVTDEVGPYPLFLAARSDATPYVMSPLFCGNDGEQYERTDRALTIADAAVTAGAPLDNQPAIWSRIGSLANTTASHRRGLREGLRFDALAVYPLLERRCRYLVVCDATPDPTYSFAALAMAIRKCRVNLGVELDLDVSKLGSHTQALRHFEPGGIRYPDGDTGVLLYVRPTMTGDEPPDVLRRHREDNGFPWGDSGTTFTASDFESYRRLGEHTIETLVAESSAAPSQREPTFLDLLDHFKPRLTSTAETPSEPANSTHLSEELVDAVASGDCVLCSGDGLAAQAGLLTRRSLLEGLVSLGRQQSLIDPASASDLLKVIERREFDDASDELTFRLSEATIRDYMRSSTPPTLTPSACHAILAQMPFLGAIDTTPIAMVGRAFGSAALARSDTAAQLSALQARTFFFVNAAGTSEDADPFALTNRQFRRQLQENPGFQQFLATIFLRHHVLYIGSSIDAIRDFLDSLDLSKRPERRQFALVADDGTLDSVKIRQLDRTYNLEVVPYRPGFKFEGLQDVLERLRQRLASRAKPRRAVSGTQALRAVELTNIGPFASLRLELTPSWNLLLGNNGTGKTVILRAIAAALCGEQADSAAAGRLLSSNAPRGAIRLEAEGREYGVELIREPNGRVKLASASLSPLHVDRWLVLGFPALRNVPWENPSGPNDLPGKDPSVDDVLPLLRGDVDLRTRGLKQWLVNLDYTGRQHVITRFFNVLQALTPGLEIGFAGIDKESMEIRVRTNAGVVPLGSVSQGTASVLCWIGALLQRMAEAGSSQTDRVLVLIDEIDAHMHPRWQQLFVDVFKAQFPGAQVIATTHSPLLVGSLSKEEIWLVQSDAIRSEIYGVARVLTPANGPVEVVVSGPEPESDEKQERDVRRYVITGGAPLRIRDGEIVEKGEALTNGEARVTAERLEIPAEGWRVDQILTLPFFGLESTRDQRTRALVEEFTRLSTLAEPTIQERVALDEVATKLRIRAPAPHETEEARKAYEIINDFADERLKEATPDERARVLAELQVQLTESITGSRRPL